MAEFVEERTKNERQKMEKALKRGYWKCSLSSEQIIPKQTTFLTSRKTMAIVVRVVEHKSPNCYGFLSNFPNKFIESSSFAVFKCSRVEAPETSFALQVFASKPPFEYLHLNRVFIQRLGLNLNDQLILEQVRDVNYCQWMEIKPETFEDWNIVENTSEVIEEDFLRQLRVVQEDLPFVLFLSSGISINFKVVQIGPKLPKGAPALISNATQVMVAPLSQPKLSEYSSGCNHPDILHDSVSLFNPLRFFISPGKPQMTLRILPKVYLKTLKVKLPNSTVVTIGNENYVKTTIYRVIRPGATSIYINLVVLPKRSTALYGNLETIHDVLSKLPNGHCYISYDLQQQGLQPFMRILCFPVNEYEIRPLKTILYSSSVLLKPRSLEMALKDAFKNNLYVPFLISGAGCEVALANPDGHFKVKLIPTEGIDATKQCGVFLMDKLPEFRQSEHEIKIPPSPEQKTVHNFGEKPSKLQSFQFQSTFSAEILVYLSTICQQHECNGFNTLICGEEFSGKTTILEILSASLYQKLKVFSLKVDCNEFKGKSPDNIALFLDQKLRYLQNRWPSVLFLDEFDFLNKEFEDEERSKFISKVYLKISSLITDYKIPVVATARSYHFLSSDALTFNGRRFFTLVKEMPQLDQVEYIRLLRHLVPAVQIEDDYRNKNLSRYNLGEMMRFCERVKLQFLGRAVTSDDLDELLNVISRRDDEDKDKRGFKQVGGFENIKQKLVQIYMWPSKYAEVYQEIGVKVGNAAILHGPTGCGKTLLARALAEETGFTVNFVKGPELLSKYIGQSEENVRNVFEKARRSKPSLIVFDEFDALVPKRGHDNTGVTDRVVNQFLTELDGVDSSMEGIYVMATTNRLDLIDDALLRPGRFDHKIYVDHPDEFSRLAILEQLTKEMEVEKPSDLNQFALKTASWSAAELRGLIVNATFEASRVGSEKIQTEHLEESFKQTMESKNKKRNQKEFKFGERITLA